MFFFFVFFFCFFFFNLSHFPVTAIDLHGTLHLSLMYQKVLWAFLNFYQLSLVELHLFVFFLFFLFFNLSHFPVTAIDLHGTLHLSLMYQKVLWAFLNFYQLSLVELHLFVCFFLFFFLTYLIFPWLLLTSMELYICPLCIRKFSELSLIFINCHLLSFICLFFFFCFFLTYLIFPWLLLTSMELYICLCHFCVGGNNVFIFFMWSMSFKCLLKSNKFLSYHIYQPPLGQDMTQGRFLSGV